MTEKKTGICAHSKTIRTCIMYFLLKVQSRSMLKNIQTKKFFYRRSSTISLSKMDLDKSSNNAKKTKKCMISKENHFYTHNKYCTHFLYIYYTYITYYNSIYGKGVTFGSQPWGEKTIFNN